MVQVIPQHPVITPAPCDAGTIHETGGFLNTLVITNNGSSYITNYQQCHYQVQVELGVLLHHLFENLFLYLEWNTTFSY